MNIIDKTRKKRLLILNGSSSEIMLIEAAKRLGYYVITSGNDPSLIGHSYSDEFCPEDYSNHEAMLKLAKHLNIDAVCSNANDLGMLTAIYIAEKMSLPGVHDKYDISCIFHEKDRFKKFIQKHDFLTPKSVMFDEIHDAFEYIKDIKYPIMVKPVDLSGGRGVKRVDNYDEAFEAVKDAFVKSKAKRIVIEDYIPGRQYDFHTIVINKKVVFYSASNEFSHKNPYRVTCLSIPADHSEGILIYLKNEVERMAKILNIADGPLWLQYRIKDNKPYIIESARRCGGNNMLDLLSRGYKKDFAEWIVRLETGLSYDNFEKPLIQEKYQAYQSFTPNHNGKILGIYISDELRSKIFKEYYWFKKGEKVIDYLYKSFGIILFECDTREEMSCLIKSINENAKIVMTD